MNDLNDIRVRIDSVDKKIVELFEERMLLANEVVDFKIEHGKKIFDKAREDEKIEKIKSYTSSDFNAKGAEELFSQVMAISRKFQYQKLNNPKEIVDSFQKVQALEKENVKLVYQGMPGSYSEEASNAYFGVEAPRVFKKTWKDVMDIVTKGDAKYGVLPIENSTAGIVHEVYDLLVDYDAYIVGEIVLPINHCLMASQGTKMEDIRRVYSHPQSIMQSAEFLNDHANVEAIRMKNNAFAAKKVAEDAKMDQAAIASENAAKIYGLEILKSQVNDEKSNSTRFIVISKDKVFEEEARKISISFEISHESASLYRTLSHIIFNDLNMTKIESRPIKNRNWEYRFFVDFEGNLKDASVQNALLGLEEETLHLKILGNYR